MQASFSYYFLSSMLCLVEWWKSSTLLQKELGCRRSLAAIETQETKEQEEKDSLGQRKEESNV